MQSDSLKLRRPPRHWSLPASSSLAAPTAASIWPRHGRKVEISSRSATTVIRGARPQGRDRLALGRKDNLSQPARQAATLYLVPELAIKPMSLSVLPDHNRHPCKVFVELPARYKNVVFSV
jgi:hypothetical protein